VPNIQTHQQWLRSLKAEPTQKTFKVLDPGGKDDSVHEIDISMLADGAETGESSADRTGWAIDVRYTQAPDVVLFTNTYPTEELAKQVMDDLATAAASVEGLIRQADFEGAQEAMQGLTKLFTSSSAEPPVQDASGGYK